jgi:hypothetical protein
VANAPDESFPSEKEESMQFGLEVPTTGAYADARLLAQFAREAEAAGWDGFLVGDVLLDLEAVIAPWITLTAIALSTTSLKLGCPRCRWRVIAPGTPPGSWPISSRCLGPGLLYCRITRWLIKSGRKVLLDRIAVGRLLLRHPFHHLVPYPYLTNQRYCCIP